MGPLNVAEITKASCHLSWRPPKEDGGSKIAGYHVERQEVGKPYWTTVASRCKVCRLTLHMLLYALNMVS